MEVKLFDGKFKIRWQLMFYDIIVYLVVIGFIYTTYGLARSTLGEFICFSALSLLCILICRTVGRVYSMIIRYGGVHVYMRLFATDLIAILFYFPLKFGLGLQHMTSQRWLIIILLNLLGAVGIRLTLPEESSFFTSVGHPFPAVCIRTSTERPEALDKGCFILAGIDENSLLQAVDTAVEMVKNGDNGIPVPDYVDENVSDKVVKIIQSYTGVVNKMVWRKF